MRAALLLLAAPLTLSAQSLPSKTQELIDEAEQAWKAGDCANAYPLLKEAFLQSKQPRLLTSIGQCAAFLQLDASALAAYCAYQNLEPNSPYRDTVDGLIQELSTKTNQSCPESSTFYKPEKAPEEEAPPPKKVSAIMMLGAASGTVKGITDNSRAPIAGGNSLPELVLAPEIAFYATPKLTVGALGLFQLTNTDGATAIRQSQPSAALRVRYFYAKRERFRPLAAGEIGFGRFVQNFPTNFDGNELGNDSVHNVGPFLGAAWGFEEDFTQNMAFTGGFSLRGYLADNPLTGTENIPILMFNLSLGLRFGM
jgi:hypothetical protein